MINEKQKIARNLSLKFHILIKKRKEKKERNDNTILKTKNDSTYNLYQLNHNIDLMISTFFTISFFSVFSRLNVD